MQPDNAAGPGLHWGGMWPSAVRLWRCEGLTSNLRGKSPTWALSPPRTAVPRYPFAWAAFVTIISMCSVVMGLQELCH